MWLILLLVAAASPSIAAATCVLLESGQTLAATWSVRRPVCVIAGGEGPVAMQVVVEQPIDLAIRVRNGSDTHFSTVDSFSFGPETVTLRKVGTYSLEITPASPATTFKVSIASRDVSLPEAEIWSEAEKAATAAKRTRDKTDLDTALQLWRALENKSRIARTQLIQGTVDFRAGALRPARETYESARRFCLDLTDERCLAEVANNLGAVSRRLGNYEDSRRFLNEAALSWRRLSQPVFEGRTLTNLGLLQWQSGDYQSALASLETARKLLEGRDWASHGRVLNSLGLCYISLAEYARARAILQRALTSYRHPSLKAEIARPLVNLGWAYLLAGEYHLARTTLESARARATQLKDNLALLPALSNLGAAYRRLGNRQEARKRLDQALQMAHQLGDKPKEANTLFEIGMLASEESNYEEARRRISEAVEIQRSIWTRNEEAASLLALARLERRTGDSSRAHDLAERSLALLESTRNQVSTPSLRASYFARKRSVFDLLLDLTISDREANHAAKSLLIAERSRSRALLDLLASDSMSIAPPEVIQERSRTQRQIGDLTFRMSQPDAQPESIRQSVELLLARNDALEARFWEAVAPAGFGKPLASVDGLRAGHIAEDTALLEYYLGETRSYLWLVDSGGVQVFDLPARKVVEGQVARVTALFDAILERRRNPARQAQFTRAMQRLSQTVLGPLRHVELPEHLILVLDGGLHRAPFAALTLSPGGRALGLNHDLILAPSGGFLAQTRRPKRPRMFPKSVLAVADPVFSSRDPRVEGTRTPTQRSNGIDLPRLPFSAELDTLPSLTPASRVSILRGFDASPAALQKHPMKDYAVIYLSTHTTIDTLTPEMSYVTLSLVDRNGKAVEGLLRPFQLSQWKLDGSVVILASCETALGKQVLGEGLDGFTSALFLAGASQLVLSTSKVDAEATSNFFVSFYRSYLGNQGETLERSLTLARQAMADSARWADPYYWASFTAIGGPTEVRQGPLTGAWKVQGKK